MGKKRNQRLQTVQYIYDSVWLYKIKQHCENYDYYVL